MTETPKPESVELLPGVDFKQMLDIVAALRAALSADTDAIRKVRDEMAADAKRADRNDDGLLESDHVFEWCGRLDAILERRK